MPQTVLSTLPLLYLAVGEAYRSVFVLYVWPWLADTFKGALNLATRRTPEEWFWLIIFVQLIISQLGISEPKVSHLIPNATLSNQLKNSQLEAMSPSSQIILLSASSGILV